MGVVESDGGVVEGGVVMVGVVEGDDGGSSGG